MSKDRLVPKTQIANVIGSICLNPDLIMKEGINLEPKDFAKPVYKVIFNSILNIRNSSSDIKRITVQDIANDISLYSECNNIYKLNNGEDFLFTAIDSANVNLFEDSYNILKKFSLLRDCDNAGLSIVDLYDYNTIDVVLQKKQMEHIVNSSIDDIISHFNDKLARLKGDWSFSNEKTDFDVSHGLDTLLERLHSSPDVGHYFMNGFYNRIFKGMRKGKLMIRSAGTGVGKTRLALADICTISCPELFDLEANEYVSNGKTYPTCFISTELEIEELQTCMIAFISGVSEEVIKQGRYSQEILNRVTKAMEILEKSPISLHYIDDFSIGDIELIIERDVVNNGVEYVFFDYIQLVPKLAQTMQQSYNMPLREDQILVNLSSRLKLLCNKYDIYMSTSTQLNRSSKEHENRDSSAIRGSSAIIDKADHAVMCFKVTQKDRDKLNETIKRYELQNSKMPGSTNPNFSHYVYKNRSGTNGVIIWTSIDYSNMRERILFVTDMDYELLPMSPEYFEIEE